MKTCELCNSVARMYCGSDRAILCWDCDVKVHAANFLVSKHSRTLLCHACQSPTPWTASGPKLDPMISVCQTCVRAGNIAKSNGDAENDGDDREELKSDTEADADADDDDDDDSGDGGGGDSDSDGDGDEDDGNDQVVPLSFTTTTTLVSNSSGSEESSGTLRSAKSTIGFSSKRSRENADLCSDV
ncbi:hypothetical protein U1Q18_009042 [Sarracenia purpurea var. burkii]